MHEYIRHFLFIKKRSKIILMKTSEISISEWAASLTGQQPFYVAIIDEEGRLTFTNSYFYTHFLSARHVAADSFFDLVHQGDRMQLQDSLRECSLRGNSTTAEIRIKNQLQHWIKWEISCIKRPERQPEKFLCLGYDIPGKEQLKKPIQVFGLDATAFGKKLNWIIPPMVAGFICSKIALVLRCNRQDGSILKSLMADGKEHVYQVTVFPIYGAASGVMVGGEALDITEAYNARQEEKKVSERLLYISKATSEAIWDWNIETGLLYFNQALHDLVGTDPSQISGLGWCYDCIHLEDRLKVEQIIHNALEKGDQSWGGGIPVPLSRRAIQNDAQPRLYHLRGKGGDPDDRFLTGCLGNKKTGDAVGEAETKTAKRESPRPSSRPRRTSVPASAMNCMTMSTRSFLPRSYSSASWRMAPIISRK